jgi:hypothetical protein
MAAEEVDVKVGIEINGAATLKGLKQELKEAQGQALALSRRFGELSPEAQEAVKRVAELKDEIGDLNERIDLMDPGNKFAAFGNVVKGVAGGFTAAQGALATFGAESEDLQKTLVKLQGAMALSEGLSTITDSWKDFQRLGSVIRTQVVGAFSSLKGAIAATGLGLLIIALGVVAANFEEIENWLKKVIPGFEGFGKIIENLKAALSAFGTAAIETLKGVGSIIVKVFTGDALGAIEEAKGLGEKVGTAYRQGVEREMQKLNISRFAEKRRQQVEDLEIEITKIEAEEGRKRYDLRLQQNDKLRDALFAEDKATTKEFADALAERSNLQREQASAVEEERKKRADAAKAARDKQFQEELSELKFQQEQQAKVLQLQGIDTFKLRELQLIDQKTLYEKFQQDLIEINRGIADEELNQRIALNTALAEIDEQSNQKRKDGLLSVITAQQQLLAEQSAAQDEINRKEQEAAAIKEQAESAKRAALSVTSDALGAASQLAGEQTAVGKGLAIAQTTISTYAGAQAAFSSLAAIPIVGPALGAIAAAAAVVSGIANVKKIVSVKAPGAVSSTPAISSAAGGVQMPRVGSSANTMINQLDQVNTNLQQPRRVYVLESDITDTQERVASIEANAKF